MSSVVRYYLFLHVFMHPVYIDIIRSLSGFYPESEAKALAKGILAEVFRFSTLDLYDGKDRDFSEKEHAELKIFLPD